MGVAVSYFKHSIELFEQANEKVISFPQFKKNVQEKLKEAEDQHKNAIEKNEKVFEYGHVPDVESLEVPRPKNLMADFGGVQLPEFKKNPKLHDALKDLVPKEVQENQ